MDKFVTSGALKKTIDLTKDNLAEHDARLQNIENATPTELQCENVVTKIPDNVQNVMQLTSVQGKTLQNHVPIPYDFYSRGGNLEVLDGNYIKITATGAYHNAMLNCISTLKENTTYTIILDIKENTLTSSDNSTDILFHITSLGNTHQFNDNFGIRNETGIIKKAITTVSDFSICINGISSFVNNITTSGHIVYRLMVLEGDWTNKEIPPYFEGIQSVQNPLDVQVTGKNLLDLSAPVYKEPRQDTTTFSTYDNGVLTVKNTTSINYAWVGYRLNLIPNRTYILKWDEEVVSGQSGSCAIYNYNVTRTVNFATLATRCKRFAAPSDGRVTIVFYSNATSASMLGEVRYTNAQLELAQEPTEFEPYCGLNYTFLFDGELRSLPNGVCDEIKDGKLIRRVGKVVLNGSESWFIGDNTTYSDTVLRFNLNYDLVKASGDIKGHIICDKIPNSLYLEGGNVSNSIRVHGTTNQIMFFIDSSKLATADATTFKTYLTSNPHTVYYELATPEIIELETIYNNPVIKAYTNGNIIQNNEPIHPTLTFEYSTGLQGKINDLQVEVEQHEAEIHNMLANETGLQTVTERVNDLVMQDGNIKLEEMQGNTAQNLVGKYSNWRQFGNFTTSGDYATVNSLEEVQEYACWVSDINSSVPTENDPLLLQTGKTYTMILIELPSAERIFTLNQFNSSTGSYVTLFNGNLSQSNNKFVFTVDSNYPCERFILYNRLAIGDSFKIRNNIMILEGDWTGKEIPEYFTGIKSANEEQTGLQVRSVGKNLFDVHEFADKMNQHPSTSYNVYSVDETDNLIVSAVDSRTDGFFYEIHVKEGVTYTISAGNKFTPRVYQILKGNTYNTYKLIHSSNHVQVTSFTPTFTGYIGLKFINVSDTSITYPYSFGNIQVEEGSVATDYEPYKESVITIPYTEPLRRLPNGVADTIEDGKVIRRIGEYTLNGSENWTMGNIGASDTSANITRFYCTNKLVTKEHQDRLCILSDKLPTIDSNAYLYSEGIMQGYGNPYLYIHLDNSKLSELSANAFKTWLQSNPVTVYYELDKYTNESAIVEEIPEITLAGYKHLIFDNDIVPTSATVSFANSNYARLVALEKANVAQSKTIADLCGVVDFITLQIGDIAGILDYINGKDV